jgi:hypothetical protein
MCHFSRIASAYVISAVYVGTIAGTIYTSRVTTDVCLAYVLANFYAVAFMAVMPVR